MMSYILDLDLNNIDLDDNNCNEDYPDTIVHVRLLAWHKKLLDKKKKKKIREELMPIAWHPRRWWNFCISGDEKIEIEPVFPE